MMQQLAMNPYWGVDFFGFILLWLKRMVDLFFGDLSVSQLTSDELQVFVLVVVAISSALVGSFLLLRRLTMLANSLSHTILCGIVIAFLLTTGDTAHGDLYPALNLKVMFLASLLTGLVTTFLTEFLCKGLKLQEDASNGLVFTSLFALGVILATLYTRNTHVGIEVIMGNVDALSIADLRLGAWILAGNLLLFSLFYKEYKLVTFDPQLARSLGISLLFFNYLMMVQVSATVVGAFRGVGVLMVLSLIVTPALIGRTLSNRLLPMLGIAAFSGSLASFLGVALSRHLLSSRDLALSTGGLVVCILVIFYAIAILLSPTNGVFIRMIRRGKLREECAEGKTLSNLDISKEPDML